jgi:hypothetical protein
MKFITLHEMPEDQPIEVNPELIFTLKAKGKAGKEGSIVNGSLTIRESVQEVKDLLPRQGKRTQTF